MTLTCLRWLPAVKRGNKQFFTSYGYAQLRLRTSVTVAVRRMALIQFYGHRRHRIQQRCDGDDRAAYHQTLLLYPG